nr:hypothetical protein [Nanoarchaeota archaeon]
MKHFGEIINGKLKLKDRIRFDDELEEFEGKEIVIKIREKRDGRSIEQNSLFWVWATLIGAELGYTKQEMAMIIKYKFLQRSEVVEGKEVLIIKSTATLSKDEFNQFLSEVYFWANDTLNIRLPNE